MRAIQQKADFPLWVGIGADIGNVVSSFQNSGAGISKVFVAGHAEGAQAALDWAKNNLSQVEGVIAEAGYVDEQIQDPAAHFGTRVLTIGADMDIGVARASRIALALDAVKNSSIGYSKSKYNFPVVELLGANSVNFFDG